MWCIRISQSYLLSIGYGGPMPMIPGPPTQRPASYLISYLFIELEHAKRRQNMSVDCESFRKRRAGPDDQKAHSKPVIQLRPFGAHHDCLSQIHSQAQLTSNKSEGSRRVEFSSSCWPKKRHAPEPHPTQPSRPIMRIKGKVRYPSILPWFDDRDGKVKSRLCWRILGVLGDHEFSW